MITRIACMFSLLSLLACVPLSAFADSISISSPSPGSTLEEGTSTSIVVDVEDYWGVEKVLIYVTETDGDGVDRRLIAEDLDVPYEAVYEPAENFVGDVKISAVAVLGSPNSGAFFNSEISITVTPAEVPVSANLASRVLLMYPPSRSSAPSTRLNFVGEYSDGSVVTLSQSGFGTAFDVDDSTVVSIDDDGEVTALALGETLVEVSYGAISDWAHISVFDIDTQAFPPAADQSANVSISRSGFRVDPVTGLFLQRVQVTNTLNKPIAPPLRLVISGLPAGVEVKNASAVQSTTLAPIGAPVVPIGGGWDKELLFPGDSVYVDLKFLNSAGVPITYVGLVYRSYIE